MDISMYVKHMYAPYYSSQGLAQTEAKEKQNVRLHHQKHDTSLYNKGFIFVFSPKITIIIIIIALHQRLSEEGKVHFKFIA